MIDPSIISVGVRNEKSPTKDARIFKVKADASAILNSAESLHEFVKGVMDSYCGKSDFQEGTKEELKIEPSGYIDEIEDFLTKAKVFIKQTRKEVERL